MINSYGRKESEVERRKKVKQNERKKEREQGGAELCQA
jgi:hypothetical protein